MAMRVTMQMTARTMLRDLNEDYSQLSALQRKMSSGKEITKPSDNPYGAAHALTLRTELDGMEKYRENVDDGIAWLNATDSALGKMGDALQRARELLVRVGTDSSGQRARDAAAAEIDQLIETIKQESNAQYAGSFIFSGTATNRAPYPLGGPDRFEGNTDRIDRGVGPNVYLHINTDVSGLFGNGQAAADDRLLDNLRDIADSMRAGDGDRLRGTDLARLDANMDRLNEIRADVGARTNRLDIAQGRLAALQENSTDLLSKVEDADTVRTLIEYTTQKSAYDMALQAGANVVSRSLMDFLR